MRDYDTLRLQALELARQGWVSPRELARELNIDPADAQAILNEVEERGLVFRDGPLAIAREGWA
ncbi:helix-turn-helix domain-containing protein [Thermococcus sp.]|uniref:MarR family transcriptional regulator n=1 Tax=Thermococcus sp. TaxID=35749 RepID=UPI0025CFA725|nr:helix-turn-helix domain-containing protein [Thermococcus sp.]